MVQPILGLGPGKSLELGQVQGLFPHLHAFVQPPFLGQVSDMGDVFWGEGLPCKKKFPTILMCYLVDDPDKGSLSGPIGTQEAIDAILWNFKGYVAQGCVVPIGLGNIFGNKDMIHSYNFSKDIALPPKPLSPKSKTHP